MWRLMVVGVLAGCASPEPTEIAFAFTPDPVAEEYLCFGFDATALDGADIGGLALDEPAGPIVLHHLTLYASPGPFPDGPMPCELMPEDAVPLHVWGTGGTELVLPDDVELVVPPATQRLIVQAHALRYGDGVAQPRHLEVALRRGAEHRAGWLPLRAPTPPLRPQHREESTATCAIADELHVLSTWPHMHQAGAEFYGTRLRGTDATPFVTVVPWDFEAQRAYALELVVQAGDVLETHCVWQNDTDTTILPGPSIHDEMCGQSLMAWPVEAAHCE